MAANCARRALLLVVICLGALVNQVDASLQICLDGGESFVGGQLVASVASSVEIAEGSSMTLDEPVSSGRANANELDAPRHVQLLRLPGIAEGSSSSSAATTSPTDGGNSVPPYFSQESVLPGELEVGTAVAMKAMIPPEPPPSGLLKPPRSRI